MDEHVGRCLYCRGATDGSRSRAHAFPEAIFPGGPALPVGVVCDRCNNYVGTKLEPVLLGYPLVALPLQLVGLPGKKGRPRKRIGVFERQQAHGAAVTFEIEEPDIRPDPRGGTRASVTLNPAVDPAFDMDRMRRALHHIAFNLLALNEGVEVAHSPEYDGVRRYIRQPKPRERWPFVQVTEQLHTLRVRRPGAQSVPLKGAKIIRLQILNTDYYVDLSGSDRLLTVKVEPPDGRARLIGPDWKPTPRKGPKDRRYRASIF